MPPTDAPRPTRADGELLALADRVLQPGFHGTTAPDWIRRRLAGGLGSVLLFGPQHPGPRADRRAHRRPARREPRRADRRRRGGRRRHPAGDRDRSPPTRATSPSARSTTRSSPPPSPPTSAANCAAVGIGLDYAPDADVNSNPANPVIGVRSFGADPDAGRPPHRRLGARRCSDAGSPPAPSTSPATATPTRTPTSTCPSSQATPTASPSSTCRRSAPPSTPASAR